MALALITPWLRQVAFPYFVYRVAQLRVLVAKSHVD